MKRNTQKHPKLRHLARLLNIERGHAVGLLELLWMTTAQVNPRGDIGRLSNPDIAEELFWGGDPDTLVQALIDSGWLDACAVNRLVIHDWEDHCDQTVRRTKAVQDHGFAKTSQPAQHETSEKLVSDEFQTSLPETGNREPETRNRKPAAGQPAASLPLASFVLCGEPHEEPETPPPKPKPRDVAREAWPGIRAAFKAHGRLLRGKLVGDRLDQIAKRAADGFGPVELSAAVHGYVSRHGGLKPRGEFDPRKHFQPSTVFKAEGFSDRVDLGLEFMAIEAGKAQRIRARASPQPADESVPDPAEIQRLREELRSRRKLSHKASPP